jgi:predicted DNA-binding transcriptional regulator AlpA
MSQWIDSQKAAELLGVTREHFTDRLSKRADFPMPVINFSRRSRRWLLSEVLAWASGPKSIRLRR